MTKRVIITMSSERDAPGESSRQTIVAATSEPADEESADLSPIKDYLRSRLWADNQGGTVKSLLKLRPCFGAEFIFLQEKNRYKWRN